LFLVHSLESRAGSPTLRFLGFTPVAKATTVKIASIG
jgi:hypothetical protein